MDDDILSLDDFRAVLEEALPEAQALAAERPSYAPFQSIARQLEALSGWAESDEIPSPDDRASITLGRIAARELEELPPWPGDDPNRVYRFADTLSRLNDFVRHWEERIAPPSRGAH